ncbi:hypothetical protein HanIR_Chr05g0210621 [Helianthus annuus]|nr:hypothetical protein HanIR_Chr05g0210621 [Helianthus annuus]
MSFQIIIRNCHNIIRSNLIKRKKTMNMGKKRNKKLPDWQTQYRIREEYDQR